VRTAGRLFFSIFLALTAAAPARSQERDPPAAEALFLKGRAAMEAGNLAEACASFAESYRLDAAPGTLLYRALREDGTLTPSWVDLGEPAEGSPAAV